MLPGTLHKLVKLLKDNYWKVRTAVCITLGTLGSRYIETALDVLLECLRTGSINRTIVSETVIKMGSDGERILVEILKRMRVKDSKLICPIIASLELADITQPSADFVFEELLNCLQQGTIQVKKTTLDTLLRLRRRYADQTDLPIYL